jgi:hypothetical protein
MDSFSLFGRLAKRRTRKSAHGFPRGWQRRRMNGALNFAAMRA